MLSNELGTSLSWISLFNFFKRLLPLVPISNNKMRRCQVITSYFFPPRIGFAATAAAPPPWPSATALLSDFNSAFSAVVVVKAV